MKDPIGPTAMQKLERTGYIRKRGGCTLDESEWRLGNRLALWEDPDSHNVWHIDLTVIPEWADSVPEWAQHLRYESGSDGDRIYGEDEAIETFLRLTDQIRGAINMKRP